MKFRGPNLELSSAFFAVESVGVAGLSGAPLGHEEWLVDDENRRFRHDHEFDDPPDRVFWVHEFSSSLPREHLAGRTFRDLCRSLDIATMGGTKPQGRLFHQRFRQFRFLATRADADVFILPTPVTNEAKQEICPRSARADF